GFKDDQPPGALLFLLLRHALQLGYHDVSIRLHEIAGLYTPALSAQARADYPLLHIQQNNAVSESRYQPLFETAPSITGSTTLTVSDFISSRLRLADFQ